LANENQCEWRLLQIRELRVCVEVRRGGESIMSRGRPFKPGNTLGRGRPKGSTNKSASVGWRVLQQHEEMLMTKNISEGLKGNIRSLLWCLEKLLQGTRPAAKLKMPSINTVSDIAKAFDVVLQAVAKQKCTAAHGQALCEMLGERRKMIETEELAHRLEVVEAELKKKGSK
jgi:hypothetical protein